ncbi:MAG: FAD-dependent oxidoreductase [Dehalococcoidia bacterium]
MPTINADVAIIGSGIGGLCAGAMLASAGYKTVILEQMPVSGGRYTSVKYKGYTVPTASWMLLYGKDDPVYKTLEEVGAGEIEMRGAGSPIAKYRITGRVYDWPEKGALKYLLSVACDDDAEVSRVMDAITRAMRELPPKEIPFRDWLKRYSENETIHSIFQSQIATWCGMNAHELPASEFIRALLSFQGKSDFRIPKDGLKDVIDAFEKLIGDRGGQILHLTKVMEIVVDGGAVRGVVAEKNGRLEVKAQVIISNTGPGKTIELAGEEHFDRDYLEEVATEIKPAVGIDYLFTTSRPLLDFPGTLYTTDTNRKEGWSVPTLIWPGHAPEGKHLLHGFAVPKSTLEYSPKEEDDLFMEDLREVFPDFEESEGRLLLRRRFCAEWPVTRSWQGYDVGQETPVKNLYNVGDGVKPEGWIVGAGAAQSGRIVAKMIIHRTHPS